MAIHRKFFPPSVSRYLPTGETGYSAAVYQKGNLVLDSELLLNQELRDQVRSDILARQVPSGFLVNERESYADFSFPPPFLPGPAPNPTFVANAFHMRKVGVVVAGMFLEIEYSLTDSPGDNLIQLTAPTLFNGSPLTFKRSDFVFLEVWLALVSESPHATGSLTVRDPVIATVGDTITVGGVVFTGVLIAPAANQFRIFPGNAASTATSIATQVTAAVPSVIATSSTNVVHITSAAAGVVGNAITLASSDAVAIVPSNVTLTGGVDTPNKPTQNSIYRHGNVQSPNSVALQDDIEDPAVGRETTKRIQVQYRIRTTGATEGVNFKTQADGFSNPNILAQGAKGAPVAGYPFVPADLTSLRLNSDARDQVAGPGIGYGVLDHGLFIAGNGTNTSAQALGALDGYVYALPICFAFRRNQAPAGWDPQINASGALLSNHAPILNPNVYTIVGVGQSDRPDGSFADGIVETDILDLRRHVSLTGVNLEAETQLQLQALMDGNYRTWAIDTASKQMLGNGSGDVSTRNLICNEIGRLPAQGGNPPLSGSTTRGEVVRNFDHVARRFGDQPVVERVVFELRPTDTQVGSPGKYVVRAGYAGAFAGWAEGDVLHLDLLELNATTLGDFSLGTATVPGPAPVGTIFYYAPPGTVITDVLSVFHDDGNFNLAVPQDTQLASVLGIGSSHLTIQLDANATQVTGGMPLPAHNMVGTLVDGDVGSARRIFVELEISYPIGSGLTDTPYWEVIPDPGPFPYGPMIENYLPTGPVQRPGDAERPLRPLFRPGYREVMIEEVANDPTGGGNPGVPIGTLTPETLVSQTPLSVVLPRRFFGDGVLSVDVEDQSDGNPRQLDVPNSDFGASTRRAVLANTGIAPAIPLSGPGQTLVAVRYFAQDPFPNYGSPGQGYQQAIYFRTNAPQTVGVKEAPLVLPSGTPFPYTGASAALPSSVLVEPLHVSGKLWSGQRGTGSVDLSFPHLTPMDPIPVKDGSSEFPPVSFPGEWYFAATANISIADFSAQVGTLALHALVPPEGSILWNVGGPTLGEQPLVDAEFRALYPYINRDSHRPTAMAQPLSNPVRHKVFTPILVRALESCPLFRAGEVLLVVLSRWSALDSLNSTEMATSNNRGCAAIYRTKNLWVLP